MESQSTKDVSAASVAKVFANESTTNAEPDANFAHTKTEFPGNTEEELSDTKGLVAEDDGVHVEEGKETDPKTEEETWEEKRRKIPLRADIEFLDFEHFKNRYSQSDGLAIIEVLRGHPQIALEVSKETMRRAKSKKDTRIVPTKATVDSDSHWIQRVRIQSPQLIRLLSRLTGHRDQWATDRPRIFFAPFRAFWYDLPQMKRCLEILDKKWGSEEAQRSYTEPQLSDLGWEDQKTVKRDQAERLDADPDSDGEGGRAEHSPMDPSDAVSGELVDSPVTLRHVRKYIEFVEKHIEPLWHRAAGTSQRKFRTCDLWMAFQPGELLYVPGGSESSRSSDGSNEITPETTTRGVATKMYQSAWRCYSLVLNAVKDDNPDDIAKVSKFVLDIHAYYIDYDGSSYVPVRHCFIIKGYEEEKDIMSLEVFPMRFLSNAEKIKAKLHDRGNWFRQAITKKHLFYDGWTLTHSPAGQVADGEKLPSSEHIEGDIIIDFVEGYKSESILGPGPASWPQGVRDFDDNNWPAGTDDLHIRHWESLEDGGKLEVVHEIKEKTQRGEWFCDRMKTEQVSSRPILEAHKEGKVVKVLDEDELVLLPSRVVAYAFRERRFVMLDIQFTKEIPVSQSVFQDLKIDESHKTMVRSLVKSHLEKQAAQKLRPTISLNQDLIRGKGSGLVILLHGVPGVGKTATAEAVAQANKKPLFVITCGDLGFTPKDVEESLRDIFRLAHHWDCVLLLDEADIFLSRRELGDLKRNALVSVFLRVLEYYSGILFLTTNRVGTLDEAFKSRIHVSLYYPPLDKHQTLEIFKVNIRKLTEIETEKNKIEAESDPSLPKSPPMTISYQSIMHFAGWHFDVNEDTPEQRWNGRQIRNAFQIAYSLAQYDMHNTSLDQWNEDEEIQEPNTTAGTGTPRPVREGGGVLNWKQFDMVAKAIEKFEDYLYHATAGTDRDQARKSHTRADDYDAYQRSQKPVYNPPPPRGYQHQRLSPSATRGRRPGPSTGQRRRPQYQPPREEQQTPVRGPQRARQPQPGQQQLGISRGVGQGRGGSFNVPPQTRTSPMSHPGAHPGKSRSGRGEGPAHPALARDNRIDSGYGSWNTDPRISGPSVSHDEDDYALGEEDQEAGFDEFDEYEEGEEEFYDDADEHYRDGPGTTGVNHGR